MKGYNCCDVPSKPRPRLWVSVKPDHSEKILKLFQVCKTYFNTDYERVGKVEETEVVPVCYYLK